MRAHDALYDLAIAKGYQFASKVELTQGGVVVGSSDDNPTLQLLIRDGSVTRDATSTHRGTYTLSLSNKDGSLIPNQGEDILSVVSGREIIPYTGLWINGEAAPRLFQHGVFEIGGLSSDDTVEDLEMSITGLDRSNKVSHNALTKPWVVPKDKYYTDEIQRLILDRYPAATFQTTPSTEKTTRIVFDEQADPWDAVQELAKAIGYEVYVNTLGVFVIRPVPDPTTQGSSWDYTEDPDTGTLTRVGRSQSNDKSHNGLIITGENSFGITPARGEAWDTNPSSPTYWLGPYGKFPKFDVSKVAHLQSQVNAAATSGLQALLGAAETVTWEAVANPALEEGDVVYINRERSNLDGKVVIDRIMFPLSTETMQFTARERRLV